MHLNAWSELVAWTQISCYHAPVINTFLIHPTRCVSMCVAHLLGRAYRRTWMGMISKSTTSVRELIGWIGRDGVDLDQHLIVGDRGRGASS